MADLTFSQSQQNGRGQRQVHHTSSYADRADWTLDELKIENDFGDVAAQNLKWLKAWPIDTPDDVLRKEFEEKGVIHIKNVMPRDYVQGVRAE